MSAASTNRPGRAASCSAHRIVRRAVAVSCGCGWKGRRVMQDCCHDYPCHGAGCRFGRCPKCGMRVSPNDPSSATRPTGRHDCNSDAMAGFAAAHG
jgi:hypothetical protein